jgi:hypothetical protein
MSFFARVGLRQISLFSRLVMNLFHQRLKRAPADLAEVSIVVRHELSAITGAVHADVGPSEIVIGFAEAAIADKGRFCCHTRD